MVILISVSSSSRGPKYHQKATNTIIFPASFFFSFLTLFSTYLFSVLIAIFIDSST